MKTVLFAVITVFCSVVSPASLNPFDLEVLDSSNELELMDFERMLADIQKKEVEEKRQLVEQTFMDDLIDNLGKRGWCKKDANPKLCAKYKKYCSTFTFIKQKCPTTCGTCKNRAPAPPACMKSTYGCCWNDEPAEREDKSDCPKCVNKYVHVCRIFSDYCEKENKIRFQKESCPKTCGLCDKYKVIAKKKK